MITPFQDNGYLPLLRQAEFLVSAASSKQLPPDQGSEVAFIGCSNVGKSSAINTLTGRRALARTSKTPGRTQLINFFDLGDHRRLVDLPGYGFAKVPKPFKREWQQLIESYLINRHSLTGVFILVDTRRELKEYDIMVLQWCLHHRINIHILLTKADKLKRGAAKQALSRVEAAVNKLSAESKEHALVSLQLFSALNQTGVEEGRKQLVQWLGWENRLMLKKEAPAK